MSNSIKNFVTGIRYKGMSIKFAVASKGKTPSDVATLGRAAMRRYIRDIARTMVGVIQLITPSSAGGFYAGYIFPHSLADSIAYELEEKPTNIAFKIGVDGDNWNPQEYESAFVAAYKKNPPWGFVRSNPNTILYALHEMWDFITTNPERKTDDSGLNKMGLPPPQERAEQKNNAMKRPYGLQVGEQFIYRGVRAVWDNAQAGRLASLYFSSFFAKETGSSQIGEQYTLDEFRPQGTNSFVKESYENTMFKIDTKVKDWI